MLVFFIISIVPDIPDARPVSRGRIEEEGREEQQDDRVTSQGGDQVDNYCFRTQQQRCSASQQHIQVGQAYIQDRPPAAKGMVFLCNVKGNILPGEHSLEWFTNHRGRDSEIMACLQDAEGKFLKNRRNVLAEMMSRGGYSRTEVRFWKNVQSNSAMLEKLE